MALIVPNTGDILMLQYVINKTAPGNLRLKLFVNNVNPGKTTVIGDLTEASDPSYGFINLTGATWTTTTVSGINKAEYPEQIFNFANAASIYGYYITNIAGDLLWVERFPTAPYVLTVTGGSVAIIPSIIFN